MREPLSVRVRWLILSLVIGLAPIPACSKGTANSGEEVGSKVPPASQQQAPEPPPVQVAVEKATVPGGIRYSYYVVNGSAYPITHMLIGFERLYDIPELTQGPVGWDGEGTSVPATSYSAPPGWLFDVYTMEEEEHINLAWEIDPNQAVLTPIRGGESLGGFSVTVAQADAAYETGHWVTYLDSSEEIAYWGILVPSATVSVPPSSVLAQSGVRLRDNPGRGTLWIEFDVPVRGIAAVDVFDVNGKKVTELFRGPVEMGVKTLTWDGRNSRGAKVPSGTYFLRVKYPAAQRFAKFVWVHS
ncbi:MAG: hypothetical protein A2W26_06535 [Acidobacteria bacterium RBG_16_64_8]|nr:MAG: hypothetical protein A2W26_06535 [Acidobacteria bacterium RBG_16_64_8]